MKVELPIGDVADRVSILEIKVARIHRPEAQRHIAAELAELRRAWDAEGLPPLASLPQWSELCAVNLALWEVEDALREREGRGDFGGAFVAEARSVYRLNDRRAAVKRAISEALGSRWVEEKSYAGDSG